jgi:hypothetical protein
MSAEQSRNFDNLIDEALRAARYAARAGAMITNLCAAGNPERATVWVAEQAAWLRRHGDAVAEVPLGRQALSDTTMGAARTSYETNVVARLS